MLKKNSPLFLGSAIALLSSIAVVSAASSQTLDVTIDMFSGRPNPVFTLTDSLSIALLERRVGRLPPWKPGCPEPLNRLGYIGIGMQIPIGPSAYNRIRVSNGNVDLRLSNFQPIGRYCDYRCELEKMAIRFCKTAGLNSATPEAAKIREWIPDSLFREYTIDGFFTIEMPRSQVSVDVSMLGRNYRYFPPVMDTLLDSDFSMSQGSGGDLFQANFGIFDKGDYQTFPSFSGIRLDTQNLQASFSDCRSAFDALNLTAPTAGYTPGINPQPSALKPGRLFIIKTSENAYAAIVLVGRYIGGYDRYHFYYSYTTDGVFQKNGGLTATMIQERLLTKGMNLPGATPGIKGRYTLRGQRTPYGSSVSGNVIEQGKRVLSVPAR